MMGKTQRRLRRRKNLSALGAAVIEEISNALGPLEVSVTEGTDEPLSVVILPAPSKTDPHHHKRLLEARARFHSDDLSVCLVRAMAQLDEAHEDIAKLLASLRPDGG